MTTVKLGAPLSALDCHVFLAGILVNATSISYEVRDPLGAVQTDEDGTAITGRAPLQHSTGHYHAGNTVLPTSAALGSYEIRWSFQKVPAGPVVTRTFPFTVADKLEDGTKEAVTRRDIPDTDNIKKLRSRLKDNKPDDSKWAFFNSEIQGYLDDAFRQHTGGKRTEAGASGDDVPMAMILAHCTGLLALATDGARFIKWQDGNEMVDKTIGPKTLLEACAELRAQYQATVSKKLDEDKAGLDQTREGRLMIFRRR